MLANSVPPSGLPSRCGMRMPYITFTKPGTAPVGWAAPTSPNRARSLRARGHSSVSGTPPVVLAAAMRAIRRVRRSLTVTTSTSIGSPFAAPVCLWVLVSLRPPRVFIQKIARKEPVQPGQLHVAIIGAGSTGTDLPAELHRTVREVVAYGLDRVDPEKDIRIILIEAADRILPALPERISEATHRLLSNLGVEVRTSAKVSEVRADGVCLASGEFIPSELVVWSAGVKGPEFLRNLDGLEVNRINQLVV